MTLAEIEAALRQACDECAAAGCTLTPEQQQILLRAIAHHLLPPDQEPNPLDELNPVQRQALLQFVQEQEQQNRPWKVQLLNDWLQGNDSGAVQFIREEYGLPWLERVQPFHVKQYAGALIKLKVGDRIEVSNGLWEWVQDDGPCSREWFPCTVVSLTEITDDGSMPTGGKGTYTNGTVRFPNGMEYEIQGLYEWNRYNWRWMAEPTASSSD